MKVNDRVENDREKGLLLIGRKFMELELHGFKPYCHLKSVITEPFAITSMFHARLDTIDELRIALYKIPKEAYNEFGVGVWLDEQLITFSGDEEGEENND